MLVTNTFSGTLKVVNIERELSSSSITTPFLGWPKRDGWVGQKQVHWSTEGRHKAQGNLRIFFEVK